MRKVAKALSADCCASCHWWQCEGASLAATENDPDMMTGTGTCHLRPPVIVPTGFGATSYFPIVHGTRVCGEWVEIVDDAHGADNVIPFTPGAA